MRRPTLFLLLLLTVPGGAQAQRLSSSFPSLNQLPTVARSAQRGRRTALDDGALVLGGVAGGALGVVAGGIVGGQFKTYPCEDCGLEGALYGAATGAAALIPLGVHLANGQKGNYGKSLVASLAIGALGVGTAVSTGDVQVMLAVPLVQIVSSIVIERATSRERR